MKTRIKLMLAGILLTGSLNAQVNLGSIKGVVQDDEDRTIPMAKIWIEGGGADAVRLKADLDGKFHFEALKPGIYNLYAHAVGKDTLMMSKVQVKPDEITNLGAIRLEMNSIMKGPIIVEYHEPMIKKDIAKISIPLEDIAHSPNIRNPKELFVSMNSDIQMVEGTSDVIIRGSRPGDAVYYVDGVKSADLNGVPGVGIGSMTGYTGGIPAKYGDTTGGVIVLETKSYFDLYYAWKARK